MSATPQAPGFFGKVMVLGDFVTRRLPREFVAAWDLWLQAAMAASFEQLGESWLDVYLTSPLWRFGLGPGLCGKSAWAGVLMPSVDKVGRHFPLTLAAPVDDMENLAHLFGSVEGGRWFGELEQLALTCLEDDFDLEAFDQALRVLKAPRFTRVSFALESPAAVGGGKLARHVSMASLEQTPDAFLDVSASILERFMPRCSLWSSAGSERMGASLLVTEGLPPIDTYVALLTGHWSQRGWAMQSTSVHLLEKPEESTPGGLAYALAPLPQAVDLPMDLGDIPIERFFEADEATHSGQSAASWRWRSWGISVVGKRRKINEDAMLDSPQAGLWAVADGMGGHQAGDVASRTVVEALAAARPSGSLEEFADAVERLLQAANTRLCRLAQASGDGDQLIGSTVVAFLAAGGRCMFLWAGDSRLYRFRDGILEQLTQDHSLCGDSADEELAGPQPPAEAGRCNIITRAVGAHETLALSRGECEARAGDWYLLCSDGLDKELAREDIEAVFREKDGAEIARTLVEQAEARGARDNVTVVVVEAENPGQA